METIQVRVSDELSEVIDAAVEKGVYLNKSEVLRDALRKLFAPKLREGILIELAKRSKEGEFVSHEKVKEEFGL